MPSPRALQPLVLSVLVTVLLCGAPTRAHAVGVWEGHGPGGGDTAAIAVDPSNPTTLYVGTLTRLYKSIDAGKSWHEASTGLPFDAPRAIIIDPTNPSVVYVAMETAGIYKSTNGGLAWSAANAGLPGAGTPFTFALVIDPQTPTA